MKLVCSDNPHEKECKKMKMRSKMISNRFNTSSNLIFAFFEQNKNYNVIAKSECAPDIFVFPNKAYIISGKKMFVGNFTSNQMIQFIKSPVSNCGLLESSPTSRNETLINSEISLNRRKIEEIE